MKRVVLLILSIFSTWLATAQVYDIVVAKDGTGNCTTINQAFASVPTTGVRTTIFVKKGVYNEKVFLGAYLNLNKIQSTNRVISLIGENRDSVIVSWNDCYGDSITFFGT